MTYVLDYIEPMLENAGANVFIPRERDINKNEIIVDNDKSTGLSYIEISDLIIDTLPYGFKMQDTLFNSQNPFQMGTYLKLNSSKNIIKYVPEIPESGEYAIYISYGKNGSENVNYTVYYSGGKKDFIIDQSQGFSTWIYLGKFYFSKGLNVKNGCVSIKSNNPITTDAIRFGGGMGNIARKPSNEITPNVWSLKGTTNSISNSKTNPNNFSWKKSNLPRYLEDARYYLQYSGMPDSIVYSLSGGKNDYNDDYKSRGEWVNYLMGSPNGPTDHNNIEGLHIPIDMALAFHTDAGITPNDSIIGTLAIYNSEVPSKLFPSNQSKMANRDLVDIIQTQVTNDIRALHNPKWTRRGIWNKPYSEAWRANTPMMLLELLSHQNLADMSFGLDHRFKFDVSRAIYKGILKFIAFQNNYEYTVQPLPVNNFSIKVLKGKKIRLSWSQINDDLEPTAKPTAYKVYQREENNGFDQGFLTKTEFIDIDLNQYKKLYSFKITALNDGGESFPSEVLSVGINSTDAPLALVVNAFDRVCGPSIINNENISGVAYFKDMGVPYKREIGLTGLPYDFDRNVAWIDDDNPGWGASFSDWEGKIIAGNDFDYPLVHGKAIMNAGYSFVSTSDETFSKINFNTNTFKFIDIIFGEERTTKSLNRTEFSVFTPEIIKKIEYIANNNGNIFLSGAYIGTDFTENKNVTAEKFAADILHYKWRTNFASKSGQVNSTDYAKNYFNGQWNFNTSLDNKIYMVEAPDGIEPVGENAITSFRYGDTNVSAGVIYKGEYKVIALGFPFETIKNEVEKNNLMKQVIRFFE